jgi:hypothetical protein
MKKLLQQFSFALVIVLAFPFCLFSQGYNRDLVEISSTVYDNNKFVSVTMSREGEHVKAKYFAVKTGGQSVYNRYKKWAIGKKVILIAGAAYFSGNSYQDAVPVGLTIDAGNVVNGDLLSPGYDGLAVVYATGGIVCSNIPDGNLYIKCESTGGRTLDVRKPLDLLDFIKCAQEQEATVFQQHLLVYKDKVMLHQNSSTTKRERRFLAVGKDSKGKTVHAIIHYPSYTTLMDGTNKVYSYLKNYKNMKEVIFMLNLDTGYQDVFQLFDSAGRIRNDIAGKVDPEVAPNLLVYYYE